ncbi:hypothetical protein EMIT0P395_90183 [Pseudomonas sp. IT-P395]
MRSGLGLDRTAKRRIARWHCLTGFMRNIDGRTTGNKQDERKQRLSDFHGAHSEGDDQGCRIPKNGLLVPSITLVVSTLRTASSICGVVSGA